MDVSIPLPRPEFQLTRYCSIYQSKIARFARVTTTRFFDESIDLFSQTAKDRLPPNERGKNVEFAAIDLCQQCNFQIASRRDEWNDCYCDTCYTAVFGSSAQSRRWTFLVQMCTGCGVKPAQLSPEMESYLNLEQHTFESRPSYCHECFKKNHTENVPHIIPLCTVSMLDTIMTLENKLQQKLKDAAYEESRKRREESEREKAAIRLQTIWRGSKNARLGRSYMEKERQSRTVRTIENKIRSGLKYKALNLIGKAPELSSDSMEEKLAKSQPIWNRAKMPEGMGYTDIKDSGKMMNFSDIVRRARKVYCEDL